MDKLTRKIVNILEEEYCKNQQMGRKNEGYVTIKYRQAYSIATFIRRTVRVDEETCYAIITGLYMRDMMETGDKCKDKDVEVMHNIAQAIAKTNPTTFVTTKE